jgi:hypothetical protein
VRKSFFALDFVFEFQLRSVNELCWFGARMPQAWDGPGGARSKQHAYFVFQEATRLTALMESEPFSETEFNFPNSLSS